MRSFEEPANTKKASPSIAADLKLQRCNPSTLSMANHASGCSSSTSISSNPTLLTFSLLGKVRVLHRLFVFFHLALLGMSAWGAVIAWHICPGEVSFACSIAAAASAVRLLWLAGSAVSQAAVASTMIVEPAAASSSTLAVAATKVIPSIRQKRRTWYVRWLWWGRFGAFVTLLQLLGAVYLTFSFVKNASIGTNPCYTVGGFGWRHGGFFLALALVAWLLTIMQCCIGPDVLAWSELYARHSDAWRAYYHEMFDYGIREVLCCLGRGQYITRDEDEVDSVAAVLGDLVSYRAAGAGHLEFLAGLALLQLQRPTSPCSSECNPPPSFLMKEATILHAYAVAAYTGPLLDIGRNPLLFPCAWLRRQGVLSPWNRNRRPRLEGDNWWRGHAAAFLRHSKLPPEALRKGRVHQAKQECAYFVAVVHELRYVVVAVRGTETPEDLLTDGLGRECLLMDSDLCGLLESDRYSDTLKQQVLSTKSHFAHEGILNAARELALQLDHVPEDSTQSCITSPGVNDIHILVDNLADLRKERGLLSSLLGPGGECEGYALRLVGHSLGGSIAALTGLRLYARYPQLHVYGYGMLPCVDESTADACSSFVTSIVYNDEFSSRLSVSSIKRLRIAAIKALASESNSDAGTIDKLARQLLGSEQHLANGDLDGLEFTKEVKVASRTSNKHKARRFKFRIRGGIYLCSHMCHCMIHMSEHSSTGPLDFEPSDLRLYSSAECKAVENGPLERSIAASIDASAIVESLVAFKPVPKGPPGRGVVDASQIVDSLMASRNGRKLVSVSYIGADDDAVSDTENVCLNAGRGAEGGNPPEESEVLIASDDSERYRGCLHGKPEEAHCMTNGREACVRVNEHKGKVPLYGNSTCSPRSTTEHEDHEENTPSEMFMPGLIVHVVPVNKSSSWHPWESFGKKLRQSSKHRACVKDRRSFREIVISASMFLDHMPWRCQYALNHLFEHDTTTHQVDDECTDSVV